MEHQTLGWRFICPIGPATDREFILDWWIFKVESDYDFAHFWGEDGTKVKMGGYISFSDSSHLLKSISDLRQRNLLRSFSNVKRCAFSNLPNYITFSKPSQYIQCGPSQSEYLLSSFSNLPHQILLNQNTVPNNSYCFWADLLHKWSFLGYDWHPWIYPKCHAYLLY